MKEYFYLFIFGLKFGDNLSTTNNILVSSADTLENYRLVAGLTTK